MRFYRGGLRPDWGRDAPEFVIQSTRDVDHPNCQWVLTGSGGMGPPINFAPSTLKKLLEGLAEVVDRDEWTPEADRVLTALEDGSALEPGWAGLGFGGIASR